MEQEIKTKSQRDLAREELILRLLKLADMEDCEKSHSEADDLIIEYINDIEITDAYNKLERWYS